MRRLAALLVLPLLLTGLVLTGPPAVAAGESWKVNSVSTAGCDENGISVNTTFAGLSGGGYTAHTRAYVDGTLYMNEGVSAPGDSTEGWDIYSSDTYDAGVAVAPFPMPAGKPVTLYFEIEKPKGTVLSSWKTNLPSCDSTTALYNGLTSGDPDDDLVVATADKCPQVASSRPTGCPLLARTIQLKYKAGQGRFAGRIKCEAFEFRQFKNVIVYRKQPGKDRKIGSSKTGYTAHFRVLATPGKGTYYAVVKGGRQADVGEVKKSKSKPIQID